MWQDMVTTVIEESASIGKLHCLHRVVTSCSQQEQPTLQIVVERLTIAIAAESAPRLPKFKPCRRQAVQDDGEVDDGACLPPYKCKSTVSWVCGDNEIAALQERFENLMAELHQQIRLQVGIDTEWGDDNDGQHTGPSIVQLAVGKEAWVIDTSQPTEMTKSFFSWLFGHDRLQFLGFAFAHDVAKLTNMMQPMDKNSSCVPQSLLDLQKVAMTGMDRSYTPSLKRVVAQWLESNLDKTEQCSEWDRRPLRSSQLEYAATDAAVLLDIASAMGIKGGS